jgi:hypothetical protein
LSATSDISDYSLLWNNGATTSSITATTAGDYWLTFTSLDGQQAGEPFAMQVADARTTELGDLRLAATGRLKVRLHRSDGEPLRAPFLFRTDAPFDKITINFVARNGTGTEKRPK